MSKKKVNPDSESKKESGDSRLRKSSSQKPAANKTSEDNNSEDKNFLLKFFSLLRSVCGFGGSFILISALVMGALYWGLKSDFFPSEQESWQVEINPPQGVWKNVDVVHFVKNGNPNLFARPFDDKNLLEDISNSFSLSTIIKKVNSVYRKYPNTIVLDVEYFTPIAMVYVNSPSIEEGYLAVDKDGYLLPSRNFFTKDDVKKYLAITGIKSLPASTLGQKWDDARVEVASQIADELTPYKDELGIVGIHTHDVLSENKGYNPTFFDIRLKNQTFIRWTKVLIRASDVQRDEKELTTAQKIAILRKRLHEKGEIKPDSPKDMLQFVPDEPGA